MHAQHENDRPALYRTRNRRDPVPPRRFDGERPRGQDVVIHCGWLTRHQSGGRLLTRLPAASNRRARAEWHQIAGSLALRQGKQEERVGAVHGGPIRCARSSSLASPCSPAASSTTIRSHRAFRHRYARDFRLRCLDRHGDDGERRRRGRADPTRLAGRGAYRSRNVCCRLRRRDATPRAALGGTVRQWRRHRLYWALPLAREIFRDTGNPNLPRHALWRPGMDWDAIGGLDPDVKHPAIEGASDPQARLADLDAMGVDQALLYPTWFAEGFFLVRDPDVAYALARAYNDWIADFCKAAPSGCSPPRSCRCRIWISPSRNCSG